jgi:hypothetical protein
MIEGIRLYFTNEELKDLISETLEDCNTKISLIENRLDDINEKLGKYNSETSVFKEYSSRRKELEDEVDETIRRRNKNEMVLKHLFDDDYSLCLTDLYVLGILE